MEGAVEPSMLEVNFYCSHLARLLNHNNVLIDPVCYLALVSIWKQNVKSISILAHTGTWNIKWLFLLIYVFIGRIFKFHKISTRRIDTFFILSEPNFNLFRNFFHCLHRLKIIDLVKPVRLYAVVKASTQDLILDRISEVFKNFHDHLPPRQIPKYQDGPPCLGIVSLIYYLLL